MTNNKRKLKEKQRIAHLTLPDSTGMIVGGGGRTIQVQLNSFLTLNFLYYPI